MSKITKNILNAFNATKKEFLISEYKHQKNIDKIIDIIKPLIKEKHYKNDKVNWEITGIEFCNDEYNHAPTEYENVQITEEEYYNIRKYDKRKLTEEITDEGEFLYYQERKKKYEYLRVYVHESWSYGGNDDLSYDFLMNEIMDNNYLRKEKLLKIKEKNYV